MTQQPNREFAAQLAEITRTVRERCGAVVYLRTLSQQSMPSEAELDTQLSLDVLAESNDGVIWGVRACRP
jgi:hypothetical protein